MDKINKSTSNNARAFFHLHSSIKKPIIEMNKVIIDSLELLIDFENSSHIQIEEYQLSAGFNKSNLAYKIIVTFDKALKTKISI